MMKAVLLVLLFFSLSFGYSQPKKQQLYRTQITTHNGEQAAGVLTNLGDTTLQLASLAQFRKGKLIGEPVLTTYSIKHVYLLRIRKQGAPVQAALIGGVIGIVTGAVVGNATHKPCDPSAGGWLGCIEIIDKTEATFLAGAVGGIAGLGIGALAGSANKRIYIYGDRETYMQQKSNLATYVYRP